MDFFLSYQTKAKAIGIEYDERLYQSALENQKTAVSRAKTAFAAARAETYAVPEEVNRCYFFNPFSVEVLQSVMGRIMESYYETPRRMRLFFYYPNDAYLVYLMTMYALHFVEEIDCRDLFPGKDDRERILIFEIN